MNPIKAVSILLLIGMSIVRGEYAKLEQKIDFGSTEDENPYRPAVRFLNLVHLKELIETHADEDSWKDDQDGNVERLVDIKNCDIKRDLRSAQKLTAQKMSRLEVLEAETYFK